MVARLVIARTSEALGNAQSRVVIASAQFEQISRTLCVHITYLAVAARAPNKQIACISTPRIGFRSGMDAVIHSIAVRDCDNSTSFLNL